MCKLLLVVIAMFCLAETGLTGPARTEDKPLGLTVRDGVLLLEGKAYRGVGVNYFSLASRLLQNPDDRSSLTNLAALAKAGIPFVRFMCGGYWPVEQRLYQTNREVFFQRLDQVVQCAEQYHIGLVPSLFWNLATIPDLAGEPMQELENTNSRTIALIRAYATDVVSRYRNSRAIWGWEFGNEGNLIVDLPNAPTQRPPVVPQLGTPEKRSELDELRFSQLRVAYVEFARAVRRIDPARLIVSGNAIPRPSAWHNTREQSWTSDSAEQFAEILARDNPDPMNGISVHIYPSESFPAGARTVTEAISMVARDAAVLRKPLFVGEFGISRDAGSIEIQMRELGGILTALEQAKVPLAAIWVFDLPGQDKDWNITFGNDRAPLLEMVVEANRRLSGSKGRTATTNGH